MMTRRIQSYVPCRLNECETKLFPPSHVLLIKGVLSCLSDQSPVASRGMKSALAIHARCAERPQQYTQYSQIQGKYHRSLVKIAPALRALPLPRHKLAHKLFTASVEKFKLQEMFYLVDVYV